MKNVNGKGIVLRIAGEIPKALKYPLKLIEDNYVVVRDNSKKILASIGVAAIAFTGCGRRVVNPAKPGSGNFEKDPGNSSSVSDTNPNETTITEDTTTYVVEEDGTTKYYVSDEWGTSYIEPQDVVTSGLYSSSSNGRKTTKTTPVGDETTTSEYNETTKLGDETTRLTEETTDNTTRNYYTTSNSKTTTSKTTTNTTRGTVTTSKTTTSKTTTTTTKKNNSRLEAARHDSEVFCELASELANDYFKGMKNYLAMPYGPSSGASESKFLLVLLVKDIDENVLRFLYGENSQGKIEEAIQYIYNLNYVQRNTKNRVDYTKYMFDRAAAEYLNHAQDVFFEGAPQYEEFLYHEIVQGNIKKEFLDDYRVMSVLCGYDKRKKYLKEEDITNNYLKPELDKIYRILYGYGYTK